MNSVSIENLFLRRGEKPTDRHLSALAAAIAQQTPLQGHHVRRRVLPWGTHTHYEAEDGAGGGVSSIFAPTVTPIGGGFQIEWERGLIKGVEPTIGGTPISGTKDQPSPVFRVPADAFNAEGAANIYFRLKFSQDWTLQECEPFASAEVPPLAPFQADKLALLLGKDGAVLFRALYMNLSHVALNPRADGRAQHLFATSI